MRSRRRVYVHSPHGEIYMILVTACTKAHGGLRRSLVDEMKPYLLFTSSHGSRPACEEPRSKDPLEACVELQPRGRRWLDGCERHGQSYLQQKPMGTLPRCLPNPLFMARAQRVRPCVIDLGALAEHGGRRRLVNDEHRPWLLLFMSRHGSCLAGRRAIEEVQSASLRCTRVDLHPSPASPSDLHRQPLSVGLDGKIKSPLCTST